MALAKRVFQYIEDNEEVDIAVLKELVGECQDPSELDSTVEGVTPLCLACKIESADVVHLLVKAGASVNLPSGYFAKSPLHMVVERQFDDLHTAVIAQLLIDFEADVNLQDKEGNTPLHIACTLENIICVDILLKNGVKLDVMDIDEETPLIRACLVKNEYIIARLATTGCDVNLGDGRALRILVQSEKSMITSIKLLFRHGADIHLQNYLCAACTQNHIEVVKFLHEQGADVNAEGNVLNIKALHQACICRYVDNRIVKLLLEGGAKVNAVTYTWDTALHYASQAVSFNKVVTLLNYGGQVDMIDTANFSPLGALLTTRLEDDSFSEFMKLARLLHAAGAKLNEEEMVLVERTIPDVLSSVHNEVEIKQFLSLLKHEMRQPKTLISLTRLKVRTCLQTTIDEKVELLAIPKYLKGLLLFSDVYLR